MAFNDERDPHSQQVEYSLLKENGNAKSTVNIKFLVAVVMVTSGFVLLFFTYMAGVKDYPNSQTHSLPAGADNTSTKHSHSGSNRMDVLVSAGVVKEDTEVRNEEKISTENNNMGLTTSDGSTDETFMSDQGNDSYEAEKLNVTVSDYSANETERADYNGNITLQDAIVISNLSREEIIKLMNEVVDKIRGGHLNKETLEGYLLMIQNHILKIDEVEKKKAKNPYSVSQNDHKNKGSDDDNIWKKVEQEQKTKPKTSDDTKVQEMVTTLKNSPSTLDRFNFSKHLAWDFACYPTDLVGGKYTQVCVDNSEYDREFLEAVTMEGTWQNKMLSVFVEYLKTGQTMQVIDIGAGFGVFSLAAAAVNRFVLAVEPSRQYILPLHKSVLQNRFQKRITLVTNALSSEYKLIQMINDPKGNPRNTKTVDITQWLLTASVINPNNVVRTVKLGDLEGGLQAPGALMKIDINGDEFEVFKNAEHFFEAGLVNSVLMHWQYDENPHGYNYIITFLKSKTFIPRFTINGPPVSYIGLTSNQAFILWIKDEL